MSVAVTRLAAGRSDPDPAFDALRGAAVLADGQPPFSDQSLVELRLGERIALVVELEAEAEAEAGLLEAEGAAAPGSARGGAAPGRGLAGAALVRLASTPAEAELVVHPARRGRGLGRRLVEELVHLAPAELLVWAHGDHPAARTLAARFSFEPVRELFQLRLSPVPPGRTDPTTSFPDAAAITAFVPGVDDDAWLALNAAAFASHPEQGGLTRHDLAARQAEPWFDARDFLVARGTDGRMQGFCWLKIDPDAEDASSAGATSADAARTGEFYAVAVSPDAQGSGLGRRLMAAGFARLAARGIRDARLYVDADNIAAVRLYRSLGFQTHTVDVQYRRAGG